MNLLHRLSAVALCLALSAGNAGVCLGWAATPEARMACCTGIGECPMHKDGASHGNGAHDAITQVQADACCAASERSQPESSNPIGVTTISAAVLGTCVVLPAAPPALVLTERWRTGTPVPSPPVSRHLLLSVFLV